MDGQLDDMKARVDESGRTVVELTHAKAKLESENSEITRQLEEAESEVSALAKAKAQLAVCV